MELRFAAAFGFFLLLCGLGHRGLFAASETLNFTRATLPYNYSDLEPTIDTQTMHHHYDVHYNTYVTKVNDILATSHGNWSDGTTLSQLVQEVGTGKLDVPGDVETNIRNNAGGAWNHALYFLIMSPPSSGNNSVPASASNLSQAITRDFGSFDAMKAKVSTTAKNHFGSGFAWLMYNKQDGKLSVTDTLNQDNPLMKGSSLIPILGIDVWEHSYYLMYGPKRPSYVDAWWGVVNWRRVESNYEAAKEGDVGAIIGQEADVRH